MSTVSVTVDPCLWLLSAAKGVSCGYAAAKSTSNSFSCTPTYYTLTSSGLQPPTSVTINYNTGTSSSGIYWCTVPVMAVAFIDSNGNLIGAVDTGGNAIYGSNYSSGITLSLSSVSTVTNQSYASTPNAGYHIAINFSNTTANAINISKVVVFACSTTLNQSSVQCASGLVYSYSSPLTINASSSNTFNIIIGIT